MPRVFYPAHWKENEVLRPALNGFCFILWAVIAVYFVALILSPPVSADLLVDNYTVIYSDPATTASQMYYVADHIENYYGVSQIILDDAGIFDYGSDTSKSTRVYIFDAAHFATPEQYASGNATIVRTCVPHNSYFADCTLTYSGMSLNSSVTGAGGLYFKDAGNGAMYTGVSSNASAAYKGGFTGSTSTNKIAWGKYEIYGIPLGKPTCNFECSNPVGISPLSVVCNDTTSANPAATSWNWSITYPDGVNWTATTEDISKTLYTTGYYNVSHCAVNSYGSNCTAYNNYLQVDPTYTAENTTLFLEVHDASTGGYLLDAVIGLYNATAGQWYNQTSTTGWAVFSGTGSAQQNKLAIGETVIGAATATGYSPGYISITIPYTGYTALLNLNRVSSAPSTGQSTLIVNVIANQGGSAINGAAVYVENASVSYGQIKYTNAAGAAVFSDIPNSTYSITITKSGYQSASLYKLCAPNVTTTVGISLVALGATPTPTLTIGGTQAPGAAGTPDTRLDSEKDAAMMDVLRDNGEWLIYLCILVTAMYLLGWKP